MRQLRSKSHAESTSIGIVSTWVIPKNGQFNKGRDERPSNLEVSQSLGPRCTQIFWRKKTCHHTGNVDNICGLQKIHDSVPSCRRQPLQHLFELTITWAEGSKYIYKTGKYSTAHLYVRM
jgi:hypothetical protein